MSIELSQIKDTTKPKKNTTDKQESRIWEFLNKDIKLFGKGFSDKKKEQFYADLHILLGSGINIKTAFELIIDEQKKETEKKLFQVISKDIIEGKSFSEAMQKTGKFSNYELFSIKIGEESGRLQEVLEELTLYFNKKIKQKRQIVNAFSYPVMVLVTAIGAIFFMMNFIVPMFKDVFARFNAQLPSITRLVIDASDFFSKYALTITLIFLLVIIFFVYSRKRLWHRKLSSAILLKLPLFGSLVKTIYLTRFCQSMALLISARTPMLQAIDLVKNMMEFYPYETALEQISADILKGKSLHECMREYDIFDRRTVSLVKVAEQVNQLDVIFNKLNKQFTEETEHKIGMISNMLEPFMIIFVGVLVGIILVSMYLPMFQLGTAVYGG